MSSSVTVVSTLLQLLNSFPQYLYPPSTQITSLHDLTNGLSFFYFLHGLEPAQFEKEPLQLNAGNSGDAAATANMQYLLDSLETYFDETLNTPQADLNTLNAATLAKGDETQLLVLFELILLCAINSSKKEDVIHEIMAMNEEQQQVLMQIIGERSGEGGAEAGDTANTSGARTPNRKASGVESDAEPTSPSHGHHKTTSSAFSLPSPSSASTAATPSHAASSSASSAATAAALKELHALQEKQAELTRTLDAANREVREWKRKAHDATEKLSSIEEQHAEQKKRDMDALRTEVERLTLDKNKAESTRLHKDINRSEARIAELESTNNKLQENIHTHTRDIARLQDQLSDRDTEISTLKDEIQLARHKLDESQGVQSKLDKLKGKLSELDELRNNLAQMESDNSKQLDRIIELENDAREIDQLKLSLTRMKDTIFQNESALLDKTLQEDLLRNEVRELKDELNLVRNEHKSMESELKSTKMELEEVKQKASSSAAASGGSAAHARRPSNGLGGDLSEDSHGSSSSGSSSEDKLTIRRLEYELNKLRKEKEASGGSGSSSASDAEYTLLKQQKESLQEKYLETQRKLAGFTNENEKKSREILEKLSGVEKTLEEEKESRKEKEEEVTKLKELEKAREEELMTLKQELSDLHEQLDQARAAPATAAAPASPKASSTASAAATPTTPSRRASTTTIPGGASAAASPSTSTPSGPAATPTELETLTLRNKKLEAYIKQTQKKMKEKESEMEKQQTQLTQLHEAYKTARQSLIDRERELVERSKSREVENALAAKERKLVSSAFYSLGMEYQSAVMTARAIPKHGLVGGTMGRSWLSQQRVAPSNQSL